jgi:hypothetical protein
MKLVIDRAKWQRGEPGNGCLLRDGRMCCLGFLGCALGIPADDLLEEATPGDVENSAWPEWLLGDMSGNSTAGDLLMRINDAALGSGSGGSAVTSEEQREHALAREFAKHGVEVEFVDGASPTACQGQ